MIDFIMTNLPIIVCFVLGIGLLIMEALMPGFGIAGFSGIALEVVALVLTWQQHGTMATLGDAADCAVRAGDCDFHITAFADKGQAQQEQHRQQPHRKHGRGLPLGGGHAGVSGARRHGDNCA